MYMNVHTHVTHTYMHTCTHTHTRTHTQTGLVRHAVTLGSYFSHMYSQSMYMCKNTLANTIFVTHTHTHTHAHTCTHTDWACTACRYFGFLFLILSLQSVNVHKCTHMCTHTCTHTHTHTETGLVPLAEFLQSVHVHE